MSAPAQVIHTTPTQRNPGSGQKKTASSSSSSRDHVNAERGRPQSAQSILAAAVGRYRPICFPALSRAPPMPRSPSVREVVGLSITVKSTDVSLSLDTSERCVGVGSFPLFNSVVTGDIMRHDVHATCMWCALSVFCDFSKCSECFSIVAMTPASVTLVLTTITLVLINTSDCRYSLDIAVGNATLTADTVFGALRGLETFAQLVQPDLSIRVANIEDWPRFPFRAVLIDTSRHYLPGVLVELWLSFHRLLLGAFSHTHTPHTHQISQAVPHQPMQSH